MKRITILPDCKSGLRWAAALMVLAFAIEAFPQSSVPNLINFQGKLTDSAGNPVADGPHTFTFRIFNVLVGGAALWTESPPAITTTGGLFNHSLGSTVALPQTLFQDQNELYLEIVADVETQTPRTRLVSTPYTRVANNLEVRNTSNDSVTVKTFPHQISTYGADGKEQIRLWGPTFGEILLRDEDANNDLTAALSANISSGGAMLLFDDNGIPQIDLRAGLSGDASVAIPNDAINKLEMKDEPGVAGNSASTVMSMDGTLQTLLSRSITVPASGYVLAMATAWIDVVHSSGTPSHGTFGVSDFAGLGIGDYVEVALPAGASGGTYRQAISVQRVFSAGAGSQTFYFLGQETDGDLRVKNFWLTLVYFPTAYGAVTATAVSAVPNVPGERIQTAPTLTAADIAAERAEAEKFNAERIARELTEVKAEMEARIQKLEEQLKQNQQGIENEN